MNKFLSKLNFFDGLLIGMTLMGIAHWVDVLTK